MSVADEGGKEGRKGGESLVQSGKCVTGHVQVFKYMYKTRTVILTFTQCFRRVPAHAARRRLHAAPRTHRRGGDQIRRIRHGAEEIF